MTQYNTEYIIESQKKLVWNRFKKHKVAYFSLSELPEMAFPRDVGIIGKWMDEN